MKVGIPKEIKNNENRVGMTPAGVAELARRGHEVSVHYCVANIPGAVPNISTLALTNATLRYAIALADKGWQQACKDDSALAKGLNIIEGKVAYKAVADVFGLEYHPYQV